MPIADGIDQSKGVTHMSCGADLGGFNGDICPNCKKSVTKQNSKETET